MSLTLPGMIFIYNGDEIGMHNVSVPRAEARDPSVAGGGTAYQGRDPQRTPMQWSLDKNAGFSSADKTWLPVSEDYPEQNVAMQASNPASFLSLYRKLANLRSRSGALRYGDIELLDCDAPDVLGYVRSKGQERYLTLINFSDRSVACRPGFPLYKFVVSSDPQTKLAQLSEALGGPEIELLPNEGVLFEV
jgi:glycosidase